MGDETFLWSLEVGYDLGDIHHRLRPFFVRAESISRCAPAPWGIVSWSLQSVACCEIDRGWEFAPLSQSEREKVLPKALRIASAMRGVGSRTLGSGTISGHLQDAHVTVQGWRFFSQGVMSAFDGGHPNGWDLIEDPELLGVERGALLVFTYPDWMRFGILGEAR